MPKTYSPLEKDNIKRNLRKTASSFLKSYGVKKTTVDEIVERVNIPKGTFYLFYNSKEDLFLDLIDNFSDEVESMYLSMLQELDENKIVTSLTNVFFAIASKFYQSGVYKFLDDSELSLVTRKLESGESKRPFILKEELLNKLFSYFYIDNKKDIKAFSDAYEAILYLFLYDDKIENIEERVRLLIKGLVLQTVE